MWRRQGAAEAGRGTAVKPATACFIRTCPPHAPSLHLSHYRYAALQEGIPGPWQSGDAINSGLMIVPNASSVAVQALLREVASTLTVEYAAYMRGDISRYRLEWALPQGDQTVYNRLLWHVASQRNPSLRNRTRKQTYAAAEEEVVVSQEAGSLDWGLIEPSLVWFGCWGIPNMHRQQVTAMSWIDHDAVTGTLPPHNVLRGCYLPSPTTTKPPK